MTKCFVGIIPNSIVKCGMVAGMLPDILVFNDCIYGL